MSSSDPSTAKNRAAGFRRDLSRLIAISFSAGELSKFAERWRVFTDREGGSEAGARALVRALEQRQMLGTLVASLRVHKPLVEWSDPPPAPTVPQEPAALGPPPHHQLASHPLDDLVDESSDDDDEPDESPVRAAHGLPRGDDALIDPYLDHVAGEPSAGLRVPRWLPFVGVGTAGILLGAAGMYLGHPDRPSSAPTANAPVAVARLAAEHLRGRVDAVAGACQVPSDGDSARDVLGRAFDECGIPEIRPSKLPNPPAAPASPPSPAPAPRRAAHTPRPSSGSSPSGAGCLDGCHASYATCAKNSCGAEPQSATEYTAYQRCLHDCQSRRMRCRLACR